MKIAVFADVHSNISALKAVYAIIEIENQVKVDFIKVEYDYESTAKAIEDSELPNEFADMLLKGIG